VRILSLRRKARKGKDIIQSIFPGVHCAFSRRLLNSSHILHTTISTADMTVVVDKAGLILAGEIFSTA
jgi:hypothetical protein